MAVPVFVGAGAGTIITTGSGTVSKTSCTAGNLILVTIVSRGTADDWSAFASETNLQQLDGTLNNIQGVTTGQGMGNPTNGGRQGLFIGRATANGTCSADATVGASGEDLLLRMYEFSGASTGTTLATVVEQSTGTSSSGLGTGTGIDPAQFGSEFITLGSDRLGCCFIALDNNQAIGDISGEGGGINFVEAVAEYAEATGQTGTLQLQTATIAAAGTYDPGTVTVGSSAQWGVITTSIIPAVVAGGASGQRMLLLGVG